MLRDLRGQIPLIAECQSIHIATKISTRTTQKSVVSTIAILSGGMWNIYLLPLMYSSRRMSRV